MEAKQAENGIGGLMEVNFEDGQNGFFGVSYDNRNHVCDWCVVFLLVLLAGCMQRNVEYRQFMWYGDIGAHDVLRFVLTESRLFCCSVMAEKTDAAIFYRCGSMYLPGAGSDDRSFDCDPERFFQENTGSDAGSRIGMCRKRYAPKQSAAGTN